VACCTHTGTREIPTKLRPKMGIPARARHIWENNIKMYLKEVGCDVMGTTLICPRTGSSGGLVSTVTKLSVS
jgi:hypothetical protein